MEHLSQLYWEYGRQGQCIEAVNPPTKEGGLIGVSLSIIWEYGSQGQCIEAVNPPTKEGGLIGASLSIIWGDGRQGQCIEAVNPPIKKCEIPWQKPLDESPAKIELFQRS